MGLKKERLWGLEGIKVLGQRRGFGILVVNNRREDEIEEEDIFAVLELKGMCFNECLITQKQKRLFIYFPLDF